MSCCSFFLNFNDAHSFSTASILPGLGVAQRGGRATETAPRRLLLTFPNTRNTKLKLSLGQEAAIEFSIKNANIATVLTTIWRIDLHWCSRGSQPDAITIKANGIVAPRRRQRLNGELCHCRFSRNSQPGGQLQCECSNCLPSALGTSTVPARPPFPASTEQLAATVSRRCRRLLCAN